MRRGTGPQTLAADRALCPPHPEPPHRGLISLLQRSPPCCPRGGHWGRGSARRGQGGLLEGWQGSGTLLSGWVGQGTLARPAPGGHTLAARHAQEGFSHLPLLSAGGCSRLQATTNPNAPHPEKRTRVLLPPGKGAPGGLQPWPSLTPPHLTPNQPTRTPQPRDPALLPAPRSSAQEGGKRLWEQQTSKRQMVRQEGSREDKTGKGSRGTGSWPRWDTHLPAQGRCPPSVQERPWPPACQPSPTPHPADAGTQAGVGGEAQGRWGL